MEHSPETTQWSVSQCSCFYVDIAGTGRCFDSVGLVLRSLLRTLGNVGTLKQFYKHKPTPHHSKYSFRKQ
jgi:hypothetical protein